MKSIVPAFPGDRSKAPPHIAYFVDIVEKLLSMKASDLGERSIQFNHYDADGMASLFVEDAVWDGGNFGKHEGREAIRAFFRGAATIFPFALHQVMNPLIEVQGEQATGSWYLLQPATLAEGNQAVWLAARYEE